LYSARSLEESGPILVVLILFNLFLNTLMLPEGKSLRPGHSND